MKQTDIREAIALSDRCVAMIYGVTVSRVCMPHIRSATIVWPGVDLAILIQICNVYLKCRAFDEWTKAHTCPRSCQSCHVGVTNSIFVEQPELK